jgi:uncharacterized protein (TIGR00251 family)
VIRETARGLEIDIRVVPRARRSQLAGERDGRLVIRVQAPPVDGAANDALLDFLTRLLQCGRRAVRLVSGEKSREKRVAVDGVTRERFIACVASAAPSAPSSASSRRGTS